MNKWRVKAGKWIWYDKKCYTHREDLPDEYEPDQTYIDQEIVIENKKAKAKKEIING